MGRANESGTSRALERLQQFVRFRVRIRQLLVPRPREIALQILAT